MPDDFSPEEMAGLDVLVAGQAAPAPATPIPAPKFSQAEIEGLDALVRAQSPNGPTAQERAASDTFSNTADPKTNAVGAGLFRESMGLFTVDNSYHNQVFASMFGAAKEVGYNNLFHFNERLTSSYHDLDVRDGTEAYIDFINKNGLRDIDQRLARPLKNAFTFHAMIRNTPLYGAYRATAAGSAGRKMMQQFVQKVADTGTPLAPEAQAAQKLVETMTNDEWEEAYRDSVYHEAPEAKNAQMERLTLPRRGPGLQAIQSPVRDVNLDQFDMKLRESATRFPAYSKALEQVMGPAWRKDFLAQYNTEAMLMKSGMLRLRSPDGVTPPVASEISLDAAGMLTPVDLVAPGLVQQAFEDAHRKQSKQVPDDWFDDSGTLHRPEDLTQEVSQRLRDASYAAQEALTPFERNYIGPVTGALISVQKRLSQIGEEVHKFSEAVDANISKLPFVQNMAKGAVERLTGDRDAAVATKRLGDAVQYFFRISQEQGSFMDPLFKYMSLPDPAVFSEVAQLVGSPLTAQTPILQQAIREGPQALMVGGTAIEAAGGRQEDTLSYDAFRVLGAPERQAALKVFNRAGDALAENIENIDKMGEAGAAWWKGENDLGPIEGPANLLAYGMGKLFHTVVVAPVAQVLDDPHMGAVFAAENALIAKGAQAVFNARHALMGRVYRANKLDLYLRRMTETYPMYTRRIQELAREQVSTAIKAGKSADAAFDDVVAVAKVTLDELEKGALSSKTASTFVDKVKDVWPQIGEQLQPFSELITSRFTPGGGVIENFVRKVIPGFRIRRVDKALLRSLAPDLNDRTVQAVTDIIGKANAQGWTHGQQRQRVRLYKEVTGKAQLDASEKLAVMNGDARALAAVTPRLNARRAQLDKMRVDLEAQLAGPPNPAAAKSYQTVLSEMDRINNIEQVWRGAVPQRDNVFLADLFNVIERIKTRKLPLHTRAVNSVLKKVFGVNSLEGEFVYESFNNIVNTSLDAAHTYAQLGRQNAWKGAVVNRQYKVALEKARNVAETAETIEAGLYGLKEAGDISRTLDADLARATSESVAARENLGRLQGEYDRIFTVNVNGETQFRLDPAKPWNITSDSQLFRWIDQNTMYTSLRADPTIAGKLAEDLFEEVPAAAARVPERAAVIDDGIRVLSQDVLRLQKRLASPQDYDSVLQIIKIRKDGAKAGEARAAADVDYQIDTVTHAQWGARLEAAGAALSKTEKEIHGFIKNTLKGGEVDNWGRSVNAVQVLDTPYADAALLPAAERAKAVKIAQHVKKRYGMEPPIIGPRSAVGTQKWREFADAQYDMGQAQAGVFEAANRAYNTRLEGLKNGSISSAGMIATRDAITDATRRLRSLHRRQASLADPTARVIQLTPEGAKWVGQVWRHAGADEVTEKTIRDATGFSKGVQALVENRIGMLGALLPHLSQREQFQTSTAVAKADLHNMALRSVVLERLNDAYWGLPKSARALLGRAQRKGVLPSEIVKKHPRFARAYEAAEGGNYTLDDLFKFDSDFQAMLIERLRSTGRMSDEVYEDLLRKGYDPQMHFAYETARYVDDPIVRQVREGRTSGAGQSRGQMKTGVDIEGLRFSRHLQKYRLRVEEADGRVVQHMFDDETALREHISETYGASALPEGSVDGVLRHTTPLNEKMTMSSPLGPEAQEALDTIMGPAATPDKRLLRWSDLNRNIALQDFLATMKLMTGMVFDEKQMVDLQSKHGTAVISDYVKLPASKVHFGDLAGHHIHKRVLADLNAMSHSYRQIEAWLGGIREAFEMFDATLPQELTRQTVGKVRTAFRKLNQLARFQLIHMSLGTRIANHSSALFSDHMLGTRLFSLKNLDIRETALAHIHRKDFSALPGRVPDAVYTEFVEHGFLDQGFDARRWGGPEADAMKRMLGLPKHPGFIDLARRTLKLDKHAAPEDALKALVAKRKDLLERKREIFKEGKDPGLLSQIEQQEVAMDAMIAKLDEGLMKGFAHEVMGFYGSAGSQNVFRSIAQAGADALRESYNAIDTFYKYSFYRVLRDKMGVPREQAGDLIRRYTQQFRDLPPSLHALQDSPFGSFVVGFPWELGRITANGAMDRPGRLAAWLGIVPALNFTMSSAAGIDPGRQMKNIQGMGWRDRTSALFHYSTDLIIPNTKGGVSTTISLSNVLFPQAGMIFGRNTARTIYDNLTGEDPKTRPMFWDVLSVGASAAGAFFLNNPTLNTGATLLTQKNPRTGQPIFKDPEEGGLWDKLADIGKMVGGQFLSPHTPGVGRDWQNLSEAYESGLDPVTRRPRTMGPGDVTMRMFFNTPMRGEGARWVEEKVLGEAGRGVTEIMAGPGRQLSRGGPTVKSPKAAVDDIDKLRNIIFKAADLNGSGDKVREVANGPRKQAADLYFRVAEEGNQPDVWEKIGKLLAVSTESKQEILGKTEVTRRTADDIRKDLNTFARKGWDDQFSVLDVEEKVVAMIQADVAGLTMSTLKEMARLFVETDLGNQRKGGRTDDLVRLQAARKRVESWLTTARARREAFTEGGNSDVMPILEYLDTAIEEAQDRQEYEMDPQIERQERDLELGRPQTLP